MVVQPPFLYDAPSRHSFGAPTDGGFNPRAATQASWAPSVPRPKQDGPLINWNRHPDSYVTVPYGNLDVKPMSANTKTKVRWARLVQLLLRIVALLATLGLLFCVIVIRGTSTAVGWIIRVAPCVALLHTVYAIYHLSQSATGRTPGSAASYMIFAALIDSGLLPFFGFTAFLAHSESAGSVATWETVFGVPDATSTIVYATFALCIAEVASLLVSFALAIYLTVQFRKISRLPADMNPLEPNLTARPQKRNRSEFNMSDKHMSQASLVSSNRLSNPADDLLIPSSRRMPFMHTRTDSADSVPLYHGDGGADPHTLGSRPASFYQRSNHSRRGSYAPLDKSLPSQPSRPQSTAAPSFTSRVAGSGLEHRPARSSNLVADSQWTMRTHDRHISPLGPEDHHHHAGPYLSSTGPVNDENVPPPVSPVSSRASTPDQGRRSQYMEIKNWYTSSPHAKSKPGLDYSFVQPQPPQYSPPSHRSFSGHTEPRGSLYDFDRDLRSPSPTEEAGQEAKTTQNPLAMNPPSPTRQQHGQGPSPQPRSSQAKSLEMEIDEPEPKRYVLHDAPVNLPPPTLPYQSQRPGPNNTRPSSFVGSGSKGRYYGDLRSPVASVIASTSSRGKQQGGSEVGSDTASDHSSWRTETMSSGCFEIYDDRNDVARQQQQQQQREEYLRVNMNARDDHRDHDHDHDHDFGGRRRTIDDREADSKGRVVSNSAHDLSAGYAGLGAEFGRGMGRRRGREVSGKIAEEGRVGGDTHPFVAAVSAVPSPKSLSPVSWNSDEVGSGGGGVANDGDPGRAAAVAQAPAPTPVPGEAGPGRGAAVMAAAGWARFKGL